MTKKLNRSTFSHTGVKSPVSESAILIVAERDGTYVSLGGGVILARFIAITAKHVIDGISEFFDGKPLAEAYRNGFEFNLFGINWVDGGETSLLWRIDAIYTSDSCVTDIAFLKLSPDTADQLCHKAKKLRIQLMPPYVGAAVSAFAYHSTEVKIQDQMAHFYINPYATRGTVQGVYQTKRDSFRLSYPCFRTDARFDGGMSGGPVFNANGDLCGIVNSNMPPMDQGEEHLSYVSTLWPMMAIAVGYEREGYEIGATYSAIELATSNFLATADTANVKIDPVTGGVSAEAQHDPDEVQIIRLAKECLTQIFDQLATINKMHAEGNLSPYETSLLNTFCENLQTHLDNLSNRINKSLAIA